MNKRILSIVLVALMAVALVVGSVMVSAADGITTEDQLDKALEDGGKYTLGTNVGTGKSDLAERPEIAVGKDSKKGVTLTLDLNGYTIKGVDITIEKGSTLTIKDSDKNNAGLITDCTITVVDGTEKTYNTLTIESGKLVDVKIIVNDYGKLTVSGGTIEQDDEIGYNAITVDGTKATAAISGGTITADTALYVTDGSATVSDAAKFVGTENSTDNVVRVIEDGKLTVTGGTITAAKGNALQVDDGKANLDGGTITGEVYMTGSADIRINGATIKGAIDYDKANGDLDVLSGDIQGKITVDDANILGGTFTESPEVDEDVVPVVYVVDQEINAKGDAVETWKRYVVGTELINATLKKLNSFKFKDEPYNDYFVVIADKKAIDAEVVNGGVYGMYGTKYTARNTKINGIVLGSELQQGSANYEDGKTNPNGQPMHTWSDVIDATEHDCEKKTVLVDYKYDMRNDDYYVTTNKDGKEVVNAEITYKLKDVDGNVILDNKGKEKEFKTKNPVLAAGHPTAAFKAVPFKAPTATEAGNYQYYVCQCCGTKVATFLYPEDSDVVKIEDVVEWDPTIPATAPETTAAPAETTAAPAETTAAPAETTAAPAETTAAPAETTAAPAETQAPSQVTPSETGDNGMNALVWVIVLGAAVTGVAVAGKSVLASKKH